MAEEKGRPEKQKSGCQPLLSKKKKRIGLGKKKKKKSSQWRKKGVGKLRKV